MMYNTTAFTLAGFRITKERGTVRGVGVRSRSVVGNIGASIQALFGGDIPLYTELCEHARQDAYQRMCAHAISLGANAIIGLRYDATEVAASVTEVLCYGTAVLRVPPNGAPGRPRRTARDFFRAPARARKRTKRPGFFFLLC